MSVTAHCPSPHLVLPGLPAGCWAWRETPVTCKPPSSSVFDAFAADINFRKKKKKGQQQQAIFQPCAFEVSPHPFSKLPQDGWVWKCLPGGWVESPPGEPKKSRSTEVPRSLGEPGRRSINYKALDDRQGPRKLHLACHSPRSKMKP